MGQKTSLQGICFRTFEHAGFSCWSNTDMISQPGAIEQDAKSGKDMLTVVLIYKGATLHLGTRHKPRGAATLFTSHIEN